MDDTTYSQTIKNKKDDERRKRQRRKDKVRRMTNETKTILTSSEVLESKGEDRSSNIRRKNGAKISKEVKRKQKFPKSIPQKKRGGGRKKLAKCRTIQSLGIDPTGCRTSTCTMNCLEPGVGHE